MSEITREGLEAMPESDLDELVHDCKSEEASAINNDGRDDQIAHLMDQMHGEKVPEINILPCDKVEEAGYAKFNGGQHLCVDVPDDHFTVSLKFVNGRKVTFAYVPREANCIDIYDHGGPEVQAPGLKPMAAQSIICFSGGGPDPFRSAPGDKRPVALTCLLLK